MNHDMTEGQRIVAFYLAGTIPTDEELAAEIDRVLEAAVDRAHDYAYRLATCLSRKDFDRESSDHV